MNEQPHINAEWPGSQKFLHWLMAILILAQIGLGIVMANWEPEP